MVRGNPAFTIAAETTNDAETAIAHCIAAAYNLQAILSRSQRPEDAAELLELAGHIAVLKHLAQNQRDKQKE
jgi:hypothetical protein